MLFVSFLYGVVSFVFVLDGLDVGLLFELL